ncbi:TPA: glycosyl transferase family 2 [Candidatus Sumerlaeota bacterium]|jgi:glycosyltransferase involved in cell wall biosynthesis|nr:glycosyl transferase family 2 [Candidatus Sumerlaeota bacterium]
MSELSQFGVSEEAYRFLKSGQGFGLSIPRADYFPKKAPPKEQTAKIPKVAILLCTYHGQRYLAEQLDSFATQTYSNWEVWASDDGSHDNTHPILREYRAKWGMDRLSIHFGPAEGFAANFLSLTCKAAIKADYYAYSDQDDIWEAEKLERAVNWLNTIPHDVPALYCSRTRLVDASNNDIGFSPLFTKKPSFANALMQNIGGGNTMVFNNAARALLRKAGENVPVITHDWWAYMVVSGCGGQVFYDSYPSLRYRQHDKNLVGVNSNWFSRLVRFRMLWQGRFRHWNDANLEALGRLRADLSAENRKVLDEFSQTRSGNLVTRIIGLKRSGVYRQTLCGNLALIAAIILKKM